MALSRAELKTAYAERAKTINTAKSSAMAETIVSMLEPNRLTLDIFSSFMPVEQLNIGDNVMRTVRKGKYNVRTFVPGANQLTDKVSKQDQYFYMFERLIAGASADTWSIQQGDVDTVEKMRSDLEADVVEAIALRVFELLGSVWNATDTPNNYLDASSGGLTQAGLETLIENVIRESGDVKAIVGTREALLPVYKFARFEQFVLSGTGTDRVGLPIVDKLNEFANTRRVSSFYGVPLVELPNPRRNQLPNIRARVVDSTKVVIVGANAGKIALMGSFESQDYSDMQVIPSVYYTYVWQAFSMLLDSVESIAVARVAAAV